MSRMKSILFVIQKDHLSPIRNQLEISCHIVTFAKPNDHNIYVILIVGGDFEIVPKNLKNDRIFKRVEEI